MNLTLIFQFHKGAIRTAGSILGGSIAKSFQFHKGAIRTCTKLIKGKLRLISIP